MQPSDANRGDTFLLFSALKYEFEVVLPLSLGPGVEFARTPVGFLNGIEPTGQVDYVLPGYSLPGMGVVHVCLRRPAAEALPEGYDAWTLFLRTITCLRLVAPLPIAISGGFTVVDDKVFGRMRLYNLHSPWDPHPTARYSSASIETARQYAERLLEIEANGYGRFMQAFTMFQHVSCGYSKSYSMVYLGLFSALEALYRPANRRKGTVADAFRDRIAAALGHLPNVELLAEWVRIEYRRGRNDAIHGLSSLEPSGVPRGPASTETDAQANTTAESQGLGRLHELVRLSLLGFMGLDNADLQQHSIATGSDLKKWLSSSKKLDGSFTENDHPWLAQEDPLWIAP